MIAVFDGHNDALTREDHDGIAGGRPDGHLDIPKMRAGGIRGAIFAVFTSSDGEREEPLPREDGVLEFELAPEVEHPAAAADAAAAAGRLFALERDGHLRVARTIEDLDAAYADDGPPVAVLHIEGAEAIDPQLEALDFWHSAGLRSLGPVWSRSNAFGHGVPFIFPSSPDTGPGLTEAGRALVRRCAELGILVDLSHLNEAGFWDVAALAPGPLVASHSGAHALCQASRNLTDRQLDEIGASGGLVGIVFACPFLREDFKEDPDTPIELDRGPRPLRRRPDRGRARRARLGLRRGSDPRRARRRLGDAEGAGRPLRRGLYNRRDRGDRLEELAAGARRLVEWGLMAQFHWDPESYLALMREEVPGYERLQAETAAATQGVQARSLLELGTGTGETASRVLAVHRGARMHGIDASSRMLAAARTVLAGADAEVTLEVRRLEQPLPAGPVDLVFSALAVHHLDAGGKHDLFARVANVLVPGGRFVLADVVIPEDPADAVTPIDDGDYDKPSSLADQLDWLASAGLRAHVHWSHRDLAVIVAERAA